MANKTIQQLTPLTTADASDLLALYDVSENGTNSITAANLLNTTTIAGLETTAKTIPAAINELNNDLNIFQKNIYQYNNNGNITEIGASKIGKIVTVTISQRTASSWTRGQYITLTTLDTKYAPTIGSLNFPIVDNSTTTSSEGIIGLGQIAWTTGVVRIWLYNNITRNSAIRGSVTYILS